ncbi:MAG: carboxypeptidase regulatory-like domain-containing protein [Phycisphaeraceae bacterium]|nr:carboxypeptidase regulatory-like domain-containing protein [Phycisphaeraceae bacterium]
MQPVRHCLASALVVFTAVVAAASIAAGVRTNTPPDSASGTAPAVPSPGHVLGRVSSADPAAELRGVVVTLVRDHQAVGRTVTNSDGKFAFPNVRPGPFTIVAEKRGVGVGRQAGGVKPGETVRVAIELKKPS